MSKLVAILIGVAGLAQTDRRVLVVTGSSGDYIFGAGGTVAKLARDGWRVDVAQLGNGEKLSTGATPAQTRLANTQEGRAAAKLLGVRDVVAMEHKSGELAQVSSTEMRNQLFGLIRHMRPRILFIPDPYVNYQEDRDLRLVGLMAEEAWGYSGGRTFANELERMGFKPYGAPEIFYYAPMRPYRPGEGGVGRAKFAARDIADTIEVKIHAAQLMPTRNRAWARTRAGLLDDDALNRFVRAYVEELAGAVGAKHGFAHGEEFNHVGP
jgi:LmbE family N-acetylglucosaminyl deacetylase